MAEPAGFDLELRTVNFSKSVINVCRKLLVDNITRPLISQLIRSATSIGANYYEANNAQTRKDFEYKIAICKKEAKETIYWLKLLEFEAKNTDFDQLLNETEQLHRIFTRIVISTRNNKYS